MGQTAMDKAGRDVPRESSASARAAAEWFRDLGRALKTSLLYRRENAAASALRDRVAGALAENLVRDGAWTFRITPGEIRLGDDIVVPWGRRPKEGEGPSDLASELPFLFYRDGIRELTFLPGIPPQDVYTLIDALGVGRASRSGQDDLVTVLWQANPTHLRFEALPPEQTLYVSAARKGTEGQAHGQGLTFAWSPESAEIRSDIHAGVSAPQGLHVDARDDEPVPIAYVDPTAAYAALQPELPSARARLLTAWKEEQAADGPESTVLLVRRILAQQPPPETRASLARYVARWIGSAVERAEFGESRRALEFLHELDPDGSLAGDEVASALDGLPCEQLGAELDAAEPGEQARFFGFVVGVGEPALGLVCGVLASATSSRTRAAACTALSYLASEDPAPLAPYLEDPRPNFVRSIVFVLGQIGGPAVASLLVSAAAHPSPVVQREVLKALPALPPGERAGILLRQIESRDPALFGAALQAARLARDARVARALLGLIQASGFESRSEEQQLAIFHALADVGDGDAVPELAALVQRGGWFARPSLRRTAAARTLARLGGPIADAVLEEGTRARNEAIRTACREALAARISK